MCPPRPGAERPQKKGAPQGAGAAPGVLEVSQVFPGASRGKQLQESLAGLGLGPKLCCGTLRPPKKPPLSRAQPKKQSSQPPALQPGGNTPKPALHEGPGWHQQLQAELPAPGGAHGEPPSLLGEGLAAAPCASPAPQGRDEAGSSRSSTGTPPWGLARGRKRTPPLTHGGGGGKWAGKKDKKRKSLKSQEKHSARGGEKLLRRRGVDGCCPKNLTAAPRAHVGAPRRPAPRTLAPAAWLVPAPCC